MSAERNRIAPLALLGMFPGFAQEWRDHSYADPAFARLRKGMRLDIETNSWNVNATVMLRRRALGLGRRVLPHYRITAGTVLALHDLFTTLCSRPDFFPDVPGATVASAIDPHPARFRDYSRIARSDELPLVLQEPTDDTRYALALYLMTAGFHWLLFHEESHFLAGHLLYLEQMHAQTAVTEVDAEPLPEEHAADRRCLESHADERANLQLVRTYATLPNLLDHPVEAMRSAAEGVRIAIVAAGSVLLLFEANRAGRSATHPLPMTRLLDSFGVIYTTLAQREQTIHGPGCEDWIDDATMQAIMDRSIVDLQAAAGLLRLSGSVADLVRPLFTTGAASQHTEELLTLKARLNSLRPMLAEHQQTIARRTLPGARLDNW